MATASSGPSLWNAGRARRDVDRVAGVEAALGAVDNEAQRGAEQRGRVAEAAVGCASQYVRVAVRDHERGVVGLDHAAWRGEVGAVAGPQRAS